MLLSIVYQHNRNYYSKSCKITYYRVYFKIDDFSKILLGS